MDKLSRRSLRVTLALAAGVIVVLVLLGVFWAGLGTRDYPGSGDATSQPQAVERAANAETPVVNAYSASRVEFRLDKYVAWSNVIAIGTVVSSTETSNRKRTAVFTDYAVDVEQYLKNAQPFKRITIRTPGGQLGQSQTMVADGISFAKGEKYLFFLERLGGEWYDLPGLEYFTSLGDAYRIDANNVADRMRGFTYAQGSLERTDSRPLADLVQDIELAKAGKLPTPTVRPYTPAPTAPPSGQDVPKGSTPMVAQTPVVTPFPRPTGPAGLSGTPTPPPTPTSTATPTPSRP